MLCNYLFYYNWNQNVSIHINTVRYFAEVKQWIASAEKFTSLRIKH